MWGSWHKSQINFPATCTASDFYSARGLQGVGGLSTGGGGGVDTALWLDPPPSPKKGSIDPPPPKILPRLTPRPRR